MADATGTQREPSAPRTANFWIKALVLLVLGLLVVYLLWWPLGLPARLLNGATSVIGPKECSQYSTGTSQMSRCATTVGVKKVVGPLIIGLVMFVLRKRIGKGMKRLEGSALVRRMDSALGAPILQSVIPALTAVVLFTMGWAAVHDATKDSPGIPLFNQQRFPVLVGLFTLASTHYGPAIHRAASGFFAKRDRVKPWLRIVLVTITSIVVSYLVMRKSGGSQSYLTNPGLKEQGIVVFSLVLGWILLTPVSKPGGSPPGRRPIQAAPAGMGRPVPPPAPGWIPMEDRP